MDNKRKTIANGLKVLIAGAFIDCFSWGLLQKNKQLDNNRFLTSCFNSLSRTFPLQVANIFDETKGVCSIKKYVQELKKSSKDDDKKLFKQINELMKPEEDKLKRLKNRRGNDLAHNNLSLFSDIISNTISEKRKESKITGKEIIECLLLANKIYELIAIHEFNNYQPFKGRIYTKISEDYNSIF